MAFWIVVGTGALWPSAPPLHSADQITPIEIPSAATVLASLTKEHPRLLLKSNDWIQLKHELAANPALQEWQSSLRREAQHILEAAPSKYEIPDGLRLLSTSRRVLLRTQTLALLHRLEGGRRYLDRAWQELQAAANFTNWNPRHFLDTAEMTHAFAIGYDWLYDAWAPDQRGILRAAIIELGLKPAQQIYKKNSGWHMSRHNWNQVCNGGIGMGLLALGDEIPDMAGEMLRAALVSIQRAMVEFAPDGAWSEGPGYWNYATSYNVAFLAALQTALGTDFKLSQIDGFAETGLFPIYCTGPIGRTFNYADSGDGRVRAPQLFWMARQFNLPVYAWYQRQHASPAPLDLAWYNSTGAGSSLAALPLDKYFRKAEVVLLRSSWEDRNGLFIGFKAGDNKANHSNLDLGSFVLDALGKRWAMDLGADNYNMPGYFGKERWTYYRLRAEGHNTLVMNPGIEPDQSPSAAAKITRFSSKPDNGFAVADLTAAYVSHANRLQRGIALRRRSQVLIQDEIQARQPASLWWFMHTPSTITLNTERTIAILAQDRARLEARILAPTNAAFEILDARPLASSPDPAPQNKNSGVRKLSIRLDQVTDSRLAVLLTPLREGEIRSMETPSLIPLETW